MHSIDSYSQIIKKDSKEIKKGRIITLVQDDLPEKENKAYITGIAFFNTDSEKILKTDVIATVVNGQIVYGGKNF